MYVTISGYSDNGDFITRYLYVLCVTIPSISIPNITGAISDINAFLKISGHHIHL